MKKFIILIPLFNDWKSASRLLSEIDSETINWNVEVSVIIINDASNHDRKEETKSYENLHSIKILNMKINQGHARCIATGLKYILEKENFDYVIPMDGDGEDRPEEIKQLVDNLNYNSDKPIVGERVRRSESIFFKFCYVF